LLTKFPGLANLGHHHNSAMIIDRRKFTSRLTLYKMPSFHFSRYNQLTLSSFPLSVQTVHTPNFSRLP